MIYPLRDKFKSNGWLRRSWLVSYLQVAFYLYSLSKSKSSFYIYIRYIWFGLVGYYGISTIVCFLIPNPLYTYILNIYDLVWLVLWHINHCWLFNAKSSLDIYIKYIWFGLVGFYGISTIVGYLMPNPLYTYILNIYDLAWLGFMAYQPLLVI